MQQTTEQRRYTYGVLLSFTDEGGWYIEDRLTRKVVWRMPYLREHGYLAEPPAELRAEYERLIGWKAGMRRVDFANVVEMIADEDCAFDQPCAHGYRVEQHAIYCHNTTWLYAPSKCTFCSKTGERHEGCVPHAECPGYKQNEQGGQDGNP